VRGLSRIKLRRHARPASSNWGERTHSKLFYWNEVAKRGHFAAFEQPKLFVAELRNSLRALR
jgi:hypothetical protein